jgi:hypothetical protein
MRTLTTLLVSLTVLATEARAAPPTPEAAAWFAACSKTFAESYDAWKEQDDKTVALIKASEKKPTQEALAMLVGAHASNCVEAKKRKVFIHWARYAGTGGALALAIGRRQLAEDFMPATPVAQGAGGVQDALAFIGDRDFDVAQFCADRANGYTQWMTGPERDAFSARRAKLIEERNAVINALWAKVARDWAKAGTQRGRVKAVTKVATGLQLRVMNSACTPATGASTAPSGLTATTSQPRRKRSSPLR